MTADPATALADHKKDCRDCIPSQKAVCSTGKALAATWRRSLRAEASGGASTTTGKENPPCEAPAPSTS